MAWSVYFGITFVPADKLTFNHKGLAMNVGAPMAWLGLGQGLPPSIITVYAGCWAWTMWYGKGFD
jgi:hypothetical protein